MPDVSVMPNISTWGSHYWPWFLIAGSAFITLGFGVPETIALVQGSHNPHVNIDNTLSWYARYELNVTAGATIHGAAWWFTFVVWMVFVIFITAHIWFDQFG
jgi:hypothetical protein